VSVSQSPRPGSALQAVIKQLGAGEPLDPDRLSEAFDGIMRGDATPAQIAAVLVGLRVKPGGETPAEVAAVVRAMRRAMVALAADHPDELVDTCGTGGGTIQTFNISTAAALLAAGAGVRVAKHGNRSFTTQCGSADVLEALGVSIEVPVDTMERVLKEVGIVFMFAPLMHPAMRHVGPTRRELGIGTVMNIVGPLANPAYAGRQVVGVADERRMELIAGALRELGARHALVVHGAGMDEISPLGDTKVVEIRDSRVSEWTISVRRFDFWVGVTREQLAGGPPAANAEMVLRVLGGDGPPASSSAVVLNAAAALYVGGRVKDFDEGVMCARAALESGAGLSALERLRTAMGR
jgi:anthranilate phosphoribosyltransferase